MVTKTPEINREIDTVEDINEELMALRVDVNKDRKRFDSLLKDSVLKSGLNKLYEKSCELAFSKERKRFEKLDVGKILENILIKYPNLWFEISGKLGLSLSEIKFSKLSLHQKLNFTSLYSSVYGENIFYKKNPSSQDIIKRIRQNNRGMVDNLNRQFERKNIKNLLDLEDTLKDFGLNSSEIGKVKEYLLLIKKYPGLVGINKPKEAGFNGFGYAFFLLVGVVLGALGKHYIDSIGKVNPENSIEIIRPGVVTVENPESILKFMVTKGKFGNDPTHPIRGRDEIKMFTINDNDSWWKKWAKEKLNIIQSREIVMDLSGDVLGGFNLDDGCQIDIETNYPSEGKGVAYVQLPEPDIMILNDEVKIVSEKLERIHISDFKDTQEKLRQKLRSEAEIGISNNEEFYNRTKEDVKNNLTALFKNLKPYGMEIEDVRIRFFDPKKGEKPIPTILDLKPEQESIRIN